MKIVFLCGSHPRHLYTANKLYETGFLAGLVIEKREEFVQIPPDSLNEVDKNNFIRHFKARDEAENKFFDGANIEKVKENIPVLEIPLQALNSQTTESFIKELAPDYLISFGVHKLEDNILAICPDRAFNMHGGLSPWYRGCITMFWPFYMLRPNWAGVTIHHLSNRMDAGDIIHHSVPKLEYGDKIHEVAAKAQKQATEDICLIMKMLAEGKEVPRVKQGSLGKLFVASDWTPQHLRLIYNTFNDDIVDKYLDGEIDSPAPKLVKAF